MNFVRFYYTIKNLKPIQFWYQLKYRINPIPKELENFWKPIDNTKRGNPIKYVSWIEKPISFFSNNIFEFLNHKVQFDINEIYRVEIRQGKLWVYNLNYMDYLLQPGMAVEKGVELIHLFINSLSDNPIGIEPYPTSLRGINWIKFLSANNISKQEIDQSLYSQYKILADNLEYHLLGNHLLENSFSLLFGAFYFKDEELYLKAKKILEKELEEQILSDGGHFELSPMYHQVILDRLLDSINLLQNNQRFKDQEGLLEACKIKAGFMINWLERMTFSNGDIPHFNDSTNNIAPTSFQLFEYAKRLGLDKDDIKDKHRLSDSGYRKFKGENYECIVDVGQVGSSYIPGHAHADMLSFVLYADGKPLIVDMGISTYEKNERRQLERSTGSHNTVVVNGKNQSDVWGGFRVGKRAEIKILLDTGNSITAQHNGYNPVLHQRRFDFKNKEIIIKDKVSGQDSTTRALFHFHPDCEIKLFGNGLIVDENKRIEMKGHKRSNLENFDLPIGYNKYRKSKKLVIDFEEELNVKIITG
jgi:hypothetical protein